MDTFTAFITEVLAILVATARGQRIGESTGLLTESGAQVDGTTLTVTLANGLAFAVQVKGHSPTGNRLFANGLEAAVNERSQHDPMAPPRLLDLIGAAVTTDGDTIIIQPGDNGFGTFTGALDSTPYFLEVAPA